MLFGDAPNTVTLVRLTCWSDAVNEIDVVGSVFSGQKALEFLQITRQMS